MKHRWYNAAMGKKKNVGQVKEFLKQHEKAVGIIAGVITIGSAFLAVGIHIGRIQESVENIDKNFSTLSDSLNTRIDDLTGTYDTRIERMEDDLRSLTADFNEINRDLGIAEGKISVLPLQSTGSLTENIMKMSYQRNDDVYYSSPDLGDGVVAVGIDSTEYTAEELQNQPIIIAYEENGQQVFFMGQFDENNCWTGDCLINVYQDGNFVIATEALYESGQRKSYEQLFIGNVEWVYSKRIDQTEFNGGDTWTYAFTGVGEQPISFEAPAAEDMIRPSDITVESNSPLLSHYHGNTSNGKYNDDTGEAYLIEYYEDGYTRLLYKGQFLDGMPDDSTGEAWQIMRDKLKNTDYMLYKGLFSKGQQVQSQDEAADWDNPLHEAKLNEYTAGTQFESELRWDMRYIEP